MRRIDNSVEREKIDGFGARDNLLGLCELDGIELYRNASELKLDINGFSFVDFIFGPFSTPITSGKYEVDSPEKGYLINYYNSLGINMHRGIYRGNDLVLSKWGGDHVFLHRLDMVPTGYGDHVRFFRIEG
ncbi:hypothetical protein K8R33_01430 [archaeon]|nr:hypothetical protein [archaeon]